MEDQDEENIKYPSTEDDLFDDEDLDALDNSPDLLEGLGGVEFL